MENELETIGSSVADSVATQIDNAVAISEERAEEARELNERLTEAAIEGHRGERIETMERRFDEWQENQSEANQAIAALTIGLTELTAKVDLLVSQSTQQQSPMQNLPSGEGDGKKDVLEPEVVTETVEVAEPAPPAPAAPRKKRHTIL